MTDHGQTQPGAAPRGAAAAATVVLAVLAVVATLVVARSFLMPVVLAVLLALIVSPIRRGLERVGVPAPLTAAALLAGLVAALTLLAYALSGPVQHYVSDRHRIAWEVEYKLRGLNEAIEAVADAAEEVRDATAPATGDRGAETAERVVLDTAPGPLSRFATTAPFVFGQVAFTLVLMFFITASGDMFYRKLVQASPTWADKRRALGIALEVERTLSRYFLTVTLINAGLGLCIGTAMWWAGLPNPLLFGVGAFLLNFIPYLGAIAGVAATFALGVISLDTMGQAAFAAGLYLGLTCIEGQFVTPWLVGRSLRINAVLVFVAVAFWGWAWSFIGMFVAVPALIALRVIADRVPALNRVALFLGDDRQDPPARSGPRDPVSDGAE